jgi:hypothetical protein
MANHVSTYVTFYNHNDKDDEMNEYLENSFKKVEEHGDPIHRYMRAIGIDVPTEEEAEAEDFSWYNWYIENVGTKWCHFEDWSLDGFSSTSAWGVPFDAITNFCKKLDELFPGTYAVVQYEDEMPNFIGAAIVDKDGVDEVTELEDEEVFETYSKDTGFALNEDGGIDFDNDEMVDAWYEWVGDFTYSSANELKAAYEAYIAEIKEEEDAE